MAEDRESTDRKHEKSKKRDRSGRAKRIKVDPRLWTESEKEQLAEAIDMYGVADSKKLAALVPTKKPVHVDQMLRSLRLEHRKEAECLDMRQLRFVDMNAMDDLFLAGGTKPRDVMVKWMEFLQEYYGNDSYQYDKFSLLSGAFLLMSECTPPSEAAMSVTNGGHDVIDFRKVYYFLYRVYNSYCVTRQRDPVMKRYLYETLLRVLEDIEYSSDDEKIAMHNIVANWTSVNRLKSLRVYGQVPKIEPGIKQEDVTKPNLKKVQINLLENPMIPSFNPLRLRSCHSRDMGI